MSDRPRCQWVHEPDGTQWLVPGCMTRIHEPDIDTCDCSTLADELATERAERETAQRNYASLRVWTDSIIAAVHSHPDGRQIMKDAADRASSETVH